MMTAVNKTLFTRLYHSFATNGRIVITEFVSCAYHAQLFVTQITMLSIIYQSPKQTKQPEQEENDSLYVDTR